MKEKKYIVYRHISPSGKSYIGITCQNPEIRWRKGKGYIEYTRNREQFNKKFINAIKKYGWENFKHEILCTDLTFKEANEKEKFYVQYYDSFKNGYNATTGGDGASGHIVSKEARIKISEANKGKKAWNKGIPLSEERKKHLSEVNKGKPSYIRTQETIEKNRKGRINYVVSEETRKKLSESHKGQPGYWTGKHRSEETRKKLSEKAKGQPGYWTGKKRYKETIIKMSIANKGKKLSEETKLKISAGLKRSYDNGIRKQKNKQQ